MKDLNLHRSDLPDDLDDEEVAFDRKAAKRFEEMTAQQFVAALSSLLDAEDDAGDRVRLVDNGLYFDDVGDGNMTLDEYVALYVLRTMAVRGQIKRMEEPTPSAAN